MDLRLPIHSTPRLYLQELDIEHALQLFGQWPGRQLAQALGCPTYDIYKNLRTRFYEYAVHCRRITMKPWLIRRRDTGELIGDCSFHIMFPRHYRAEIGYNLYRPADRGHGYMQEALPVVLSHGFDQLGLKRIEAYTATDNQASLSLLRRFGFRREGYARHHYFDGEQLTDSFVFSLLAEEYQPQEPGLSAAEKLVASFERQLLPSGAFGHPEHLTVGLWYVKNHGVAEAVARMRTGLIRLLDGLGAADKAYHETLTVFWVQALQRFLQQQPAAQDFAGSLQALGESPLMDPAWAQRFYPPGLLESEEARSIWVAPDRQPE